MKGAGRVAAQAKLNLFLRVLARETSGYHQVETLFCRIALADEVHLRLTSGARSLACDGPAMPAAGLGPPERNLAWRAADAYLAAAGLNAGFAIEITKHIPVGGGLGGGSSNAAAVLRILNRLAPSPLPQATLLSLAGVLGADVTFLTSPAALALAWGRGERMLALPALPPVPCTLVAAPFGVNTAEAYGWVSADGLAAPTPRLVRSEDLGSWDGVKALSHNDFERPVFARLPVLAAAFAAVTAVDPAARMTGSGATLFALGELPGRVPGLPSGFRLITTSTAAGVPDVEVT